MANRTGTSDLPLHGGKAPAWLFQRMKELARQMILVIVSEKSPEEFLRMISDPFWFQAFGCVLGFDWHSSGVTTTVCGAVKEAVRGIEGDTGLYVAGGKGRASRKTPEEIEKGCEKTGFDPEILVYSSRMSAKVDNTGVQDGFQIYHHVFIFTADGKWTVVQQGMNETTRYARRYHWLGEAVSDFTCEPHSGICCDIRGGEILNMVATESEKARDTTSELAREKPQVVIDDIRKMQHLELPRRHEVLVSDINPDRLEKIFLSTYERQPENFEKLLGIRGVGPKSIRALSLVSELVYGTPASRRDPARFSFAHGGKDGIPYPVDRANYDSTIEFLKTALKQADLGRTEKMHAFRRLGTVQSEMERG